MADDLGSAKLIRSTLWRAMERAGARLARALPLGSPLLRIVTGRLDLRNHRKLVVVDGRITYCGSRNCADPEFQIKPAYAPWVDAMIRFEGPIAQQAQQLFAADWTVHTDEDLSEVLAAYPTPPECGDVVAQLVGTGPDVRPSALPEILGAALFNARDEVVISTPYYVPTEGSNRMIEACAWRGVRTTLVLPARNDSLFVGAASRSYYAGLLAAGVRLLEFEPGFLHAKTLTVDGEIGIIGSANLDRRSFELNLENIILFRDPALVRAVRDRQLEYAADSRVVTIEEVSTWPIHRRLWHNGLAMFGPVL
jgi:cardiolipin synthase